VTTLVVLLLVAAPVVSMYIKVNKYLPYMQSCVKSDYK
jgi:hypothetical protein